MLVNRSSKSVAQQCKYYEVENFFDYMVETHIINNNGNFKRYFRELNKKARLQFIEYCFVEVSPDLREELILTIFRD